MGTVKLVALAPDAEPPASEARSIVRQCLERLRAKRASRQAVRGWSRDVSAGARQGFSPECR